MPRNFRPFLRPISRPNHEISRCNFALGNDVLVKYGLFEVPNSHPTPSVFLLLWFWVFFGSFWSVWSSSPRRRSLALQHARIMRA